MRKLLIIILLLLLPMIFCIPAYAVTMDEVVSMTDAGVSPEVIISLLKATGSVFILDADDIVSLKEAGVADEVLVAMIGEHGSTEVSPETSSDTYLQLSDEQFKRMFVDGGQAVTNEKSEGTYQRQPQYYQSRDGFSGGYISTPDYSTDSYSSGLTQTTYSYEYPGNYGVNRKYYRPVYYNPYPSYYIFNGQTYYPGQYGSGCGYGNSYGGNQYGNGYYGGYPKYYQRSYYDNSYYFNQPHSRVRVSGYPDDDWFFSLGFGF